jgi:hypothetical protein
MGYIINYARIYLLRGSPFIHLLTVDVVDAAAYMSPALLSSLNPFFSLKRKVTAEEHDTVDR